MIDYAMVNWNGQGLVSGVDAGTGLLTLHACCGGFRGRKPRRLG